MRALFVQALTVMENAFRRLERQVPPPQPVDRPMGEVWRYVEKTTEQALLQKLARSVSGLHAVDKLLLSGLVQEQCVIQRTLDEIEEDIFFLAYSLTQQDHTELHTRYLEEFWKEEFDASSAMKSTQKRGMIPRQKIRAFVSRIGALPDPSTADRAGQSLHKAYSGYVHAASPQIMDMFGGAAAQFHVTGMNGTPRLAEHVEDAWNYFYRGLLVTTVVGKAFGDAELVNSLYEYIRKFEDTSGTSFFGHGKDGA